MSSGQVPVLYIGLLATYQFYIYSKIGVSIISGPISTESDIFSKFLPDDENKKKIKKIWNIFKK